MIKEISVAEPIIKQIETEILHFDLMQGQYRAAERRKKYYARVLNQFVPIVQKIGIERAKEMYETVHRYTSTFYGRMNNSLRAGQVPRNTDIIDLYLELALKTRIDPVYRGLKTQIASFKVGSTFLDKAFVSTAANIQIARGFSRNKGSILRIHGSKGVGVNLPFPYLEEEEILLPRNLKFKILKIDDTIDVTLTR